MPINFFKHIANANDDKVIKIIPPGELKEFVESYYLFKADRSDRRQLFFNDGYPVVAFMQKTNEKTSISIDGTVKHLDNIWVCGGMLKNIYGESSTAFDQLFVIRFYPLTFFQLFDLPPDCFEEKQVFNLSEIVGDDFKKFSEVYYRAIFMEERIKVVSTFISEKIKRYAYPKVLIDLLHQIEKQGIMRVKDLMKNCAVRLNYKWLERNFKSHIGLSPKNYFIVKRFLNAYLDLHSSTSKELLKVAIDHGYYDDNHFIKDFKRFSGSSPKKYFQYINSAI